MRCESARRNTGNTAPLALSNSSPESRDCSTAVETSAMLTGSMSRPDAALSPNVDVSASYAARAAVLRRQIASCVELTIRSPTMVRFCGVAARTAFQSASATVATRDRCFDFNIP